MKRILLGLLIGALIFAAGVGAKVVTVTNPMSADLDGGGYALTDLSTLATNGALTVGNGVVYLDGNHNRPSVRWGSDDPRVTPPFDAVIGSEYLRFSNPGELWVKTGPFPADWQQVATVP